MFFQGVNKYVVNVTSIKNKRMLVKLIIFDKYHVFIELFKDIPHRHIIA